MGVRNARWGSRDPNRRLDQRIERLRQIEPASFAGRPLTGGALVGGSASGSPLAAGPRERDLAEALFERANMRWVAGERQDAITDRREAMDIMYRLLPGDSAAAVRDVVIGDIALAVWEQHTGHGDAATETIRGTVSMLRQPVHRDPLAQTWLLMATLARQGWIAVDNNRPEQALAPLSEAIALSSAPFKGDRKSLLGRLIESAHYLAVCHAELGHREAELEAWDQAIRLAGDLANIDLQASTLWVGTSLCARGAALRRHGDADDATAQLLRGIEVLSDLARVYQDDAWAHVRRWQPDLARCLLSSGDVAGAAAVITEASRAAAEQRGGQSSLAQLAVITATLADVRFAQSQDDAGQDDAGQASAGGASAGQASADATSADATDAQETAAEAVRIARSAIETDRREDAGPASPWQVRQGDRLLAHMLFRQARLRLAIADRDADRDAGPGDGEGRDGEGRDGDSTTLAAAQEAVRLYRALVLPGQPAGLDLAAALIVLALAQRVAGDHAAARSSATEAVRYWERLVTEYPLRVSSLAAAQREAELAQQFSDSGKVSDSGDGSDSGAGSGDGGSQGEVGDPGAVG